MTEKHHLTAVDADRLAMDTKGEQSCKWHRKAQTHATLALVEQQRIANLIALSRIEAENSATPSDALDAIYSREETFAWDGGVKLRTRPDIAAALGLTAGQEGQNDEG